MTVDKLERNRRRKGQALAETGIVVLLMVSLAMGIVEFGRMLMILNMITNATRDSARAAAAIGRPNRCASNGNLTTAAQDTIKSMVVNQLTGLVPVITPADVTIDYPATGGQPRMVRVRTIVNVPWIMLFNLVGTNLAVNRPVTFKDEFTSGTAGC